MAKRFSIKPVSSQESPFLDERIEDKTERSEFLMYRNEKLSFQILFTCDEWDSTCPPYLRLDVVGDISKYVKIREVVCVPNHYPVCEERCDDNYLRKTPGLYPNLLRPLRYRNYQGMECGFVRTSRGQLRSFWIDIEIPDSEKSVSESRTVLDFVLYNTTKSYDVEVARTCVGIRVSKVKLSEQKLIHTEWFYCDCIAEAYRTEAFSELHWRMIEKYMKTAVNSGINMIMMPLFTQELDTYIGGERMTTQLVKIKVESNGKYTFNFDLVDRWIELCRKVGVKYYEIPHFFTQWGAEHAPKFVAEKDGVEERIFGWETDSMSDEYSDFLAQFIPAMVSHFKLRGIDKQCYYHISDEPNLNQIDKYLACKERVAPHIEGYNIIDALSSFDFYKKGILKKPIPSITRAKEFLDAKIPGLWVYYCGANGKVETTDRYLSMPLARTRILGVQLYVHNIEGFLHWGYNFYHNCCSYEYVDVLSCNDGEYFAPSGDMCLVYPGSDGEVWESMRLNALREAMDDVRALQLSENVLGSEKTDMLINGNLEEKLSFYKYPKASEYLLSLHDRVLLAIEGKIATH